MTLSRLKLAVLLLCAFSSSGCYASWALQDSDFGKSRVVDETFKGVRSGSLTGDGVFALEVGAHYDAKGGTWSGKYLIADAAALRALAADGDGGKIGNGIGYRDGDAIIASRLQSVTRVSFNGPNPWRIWPDSMEPTEVADADLTGEIGPIIRVWPVVTIEMDAEQADLERRGIFRPARRSARVGPISVELADGTTVEVIFADFVMEGRQRRNYWKTGLYPIAALGAGVADLAFMPIWALYNLSPNLFTLLLI